jgi:MerR family transcriptional activator of bmr gene
MFSIGQVSRIKGITRKALRFYDKIGLLRPSYTNPGNGYRYYSIEQFVQMDIIKALRGIDVSPTEIRTMLTKGSTDELMGFLDSQKRSATAKIGDLRRIIETINGVQGAISGSSDSVSHKGVYRKRIECRHVVTLPYREWASEDEAIIEFSKFDRIVEKARFVNGYQTGILFEEENGAMVPSLLFNTVRVQEDSDLSVARIFPAGEYLCVCLSKENASDRIQKINRYCARNGLQPSLVLQVELLNDVFSPKSVTVEMQLLVKEL